MISSLKLGELKFTIALGFDRTLLCSLIEQKIIYNINLQDYQVLAALNNRTNVISSMHIKHYQLLADKDLVYKILALEYIFAQEESHLNKEEKDFYRQQMDKLLIFE